MPESEMPEPKLEREEKTSNSVKKDKKDVATPTLHSTSLSVIGGFAGLPSKFSRHIVIDEQTGCWNWNGWIGANYKYPKHRYGMCKYVDANGKRRSTSAHRYAYICVNGPVADDLDVDHLCFNKLCVKIARKLAREQKKAGL